MPQNLIANGVNIGQTAQVPGQWPVKECTAATAAAAWKDYLIKFLQAGNGEEITGLLRKAVLFVGCNPSLGGALFGELYSHELV